MALLHEPMIAIPTDNTLVPRHGRFDLGRMLHILKPVKPIAILLIPMDQWLFLRFQPSMKREYKSCSSKRWNEPKSTHGMQASMCKLPNRSRVLPEWKAWKRRSTAVSESAPCLPLRNHRWHPRKLNLSKPREQASFAYIYIRSIYIYKYCLLGAPLFSTLTVHVGAKQESMRRWSCVGKISPDTRVLLY
jgi:hypothetical protein